MLTRRPRAVLAAVLLLVAASVAGVASAAGVAGPAPTASAVTARADCGWRAGPAPAYDQVLWVVMENHSYGDLIGPAGSAQRARSPYLNGLADRCGLATNAWTLTHPSLPNYLALVSGSTGGVTSSCTPRRCPQDRRTIFDQVRARGGDWRVFAEAMPGPCRRSDAGAYVVRHNPPTYFPGLRGCARRDLPMGTPTAGALVDAIDAGRLPELTLVVPDQCHNTHDCAIGTGDQWLAEMLPRIIAGPDYARGRLAVVLTWDEGEGGYGGQSCRRRPDPSCQIVTVVVSPTTRPGTQSARRYDHYSLLETTERLLGLRRLGHAADRDTLDLRADFGL